MDQINDHSANKRSAGASSGSYVKKAQVEQFSKTGAGNVSAKYEFVNIFPTDLSEITLDWGDNDTVEEYTVTFAYDYWIRGSLNQTAGYGNQAKEIATKIGSISS